MADTRICVWAQFLLSYTNNILKFCVWVYFFQLWMNILVTIRIAYECERIHLKTRSLLILKFQSCDLIEHGNIGATAFLLPIVLFNKKNWYVCASDKWKYDIWYIRWIPGILWWLWEIMCFAFDCWIDFWLSSLKMHTRWNLNVNVNTCSEFIKSKSKHSKNWKEKEIQFQQTNYEQKRVLV